MSIGILGRKLGMTQIYNEEGHAVPVTVVEAGPCPVIDIKTMDRNGYSSVTLGFGELKAHKVTKPIKGFFEKIQMDPVKTIKEFNAQSYVFKNLKPREYHVCVLDAKENMKCKKVKISRR